MLGNNIFGGLLTQIPSQGAIVDAQNLNQVQTGQVTGGQHGNNSVTLSVLPGPGQQQIIAQPQFQIQNSAGQIHPGYITFSGVPNLGGTVFLTNASAHPNMVQQLGNATVIPAPLNLNVANLFQHGVPLQQISGPTIIQMAGGKQDNCVEMKQLNSNGTFPQYFTAQFAPNPNQQNIHGLSNVGNQFGVESQPAMNCSMKTEKISVEEVVQVIVCPLCQKTFNDSKNLNQHIQSQHMSSSKRSYSCEICQKNFPKKYQLQKHALTHTLENTQCNIVETEIKDFSIVKDSGTFSCQCHRCGDYFFEQEAFIKHAQMQCQTDPGLFSCPICGLVLQNKSALTKHRRNHHPEDFEASVYHNQENTQPVNACRDCGKTFSNSYGLRRHSRTHTGERPHNCDICGLNFMERSHMRQHRLTHTGETPYQCEICSRGFGRKFSYQRHIEWHSKTLNSSRSASTNTTNSNVSSNNIGSVIDSVVKGDCEQTSHILDANSNITYYSNENGNFLNADMSQKASNLNGIIMLTSNEPHSQQHPQQYIQFQNNNVSESDIVYSSVPLFTVASA